MAQAHKQYIQAYHGHIEEPCIVVMRVVPMGGHSEVCRRGGRLPWYTPGFIKTALGTPKSIRKDTHAQRAKRPHKPNFIRFFENTESRQAASREADHSPAVAWMKNT
jgi:hypothetical protein